MHPTHSTPQPLSPDRAGGTRTAKPIAAGPARRSLAVFVQEESEDILAEWERFSGDQRGDSRPFEGRPVRDHGPDILRNIQWWLVTPDPAASTLAATAAPVPQPPHPNAAQAHADARRLQGFGVDAIVAEYRSLRALVLVMWRRGGGMHATDTSDLARFDDAIDEAIAGAIGHYVKQTTTATNLFIGILGHDIRNPLGTIVVCAEYLMKSHQLTPTDAAPILNAAARIQGIVDQTMDFTRTQSSGAMPVRRLPGHLGSLLAKVVAETQVRHPKRTFRCTTSGDLQGSWDEHRLGQVLSNMLGNAIAYGARDSAITVDVQATETDACFSVHNHGVAIPPDEQPRIFEPLVRGNTALVERRGRAGLGLGLYICREIVRAHGGTMTVESAPETGTRFTVHLPRVTD